MRKSLSVFLFAGMSLVSACGVEDSQNSQVKSEIAGEVKCNGSGGFWGMLEGRVPDSRDMFFKAFNNACRDWKNHKVPPNKKGEHYFTDFATRTRFVVTALNTSKSEFPLLEEDCYSIGRRVIDQCDTNTTRSKWGGSFKNGNSEWSIKAYACPLSGCIDFQNNYNPW